ncbi:Putative sodium-coupled neutral amino acid transporter 11-like Protein [Gryllus bimaculatus]|nr:Putative sodium-coupled neutral amino acid transporter 11-like Protein [Gryllus bimaculatus]
MSVTRQPCASREYSARIRAPRSAGGRAAGARRAQPRGGRRKLAINRRRAKTERRCRQASSAGKGRGCALPPTVAARWSDGARCADRREDSVARLEDSLLSPLPPLDPCKPFERPAPFLSPPLPSSPAADVAMENPEAPSTPKRGADETSYILEGQRLNQQSDDEKYQTSLPLASFNYINSIIGSGVIGIPYAFQQAGFGMGLLLLFGVALITDYSLILMVRSGHLSGAFSYQGLMQAAFGKPGFVLLSILQFTYPFIAMVSYNVVVGDTITKVLTRMTGVEADSLLARREFVVALATIFITIPLCLYRDIAKLSKVSFLSLVFITFMCHHNTFLVYDSIENANQQQWNIVTHASVLTSCCVTVMFGIAGYATFTGYSQGDLLENYCPYDDLMNISRAAFSITILLTYPIECFVTREVIENTFFSSRENEEQSPTYQHVAITLTLVLTTYFISMTTDCLGVVLELNGVLAAVPLAYVLPALSYVKLEEGSLLSAKKLPALLLGLFGMVVAILGLVMLATNYDRIDTCSHETMNYCTNIT